MNDDQPPSSLSRHLLHKLSSLFHKQHSKQELRDYLQVAQESQIIDNNEAAMLAGVLAFSEQRVRDVMLPKSKMITVCESMRFDETVKLVIDSGHSRFPVEKNDEIIGVLLAKDLLAGLDDTENFSITQLMRPIHHIPESKPLDAMLHEFRRNRLHMAIVSNEYGEIAGLLTIEDVIEEIVGEIDDEHDSKENQDIQVLNENKYLVEAFTELKKFNSFFDTEFNVDANETIGGFVLSHFGYVPKTGDSISFAGLDFIIKAADDRRILKILVSKK